MKQKQFIICPSCGSVELGEIDTSTWPWPTFIHDCKKCGHTIMESEWNAITKTISIKQPWAYLICAGIKDIENRTWKLPEKYKGKRVLIHASGTPWSWYRLLHYLTYKMESVFEKMGFNGGWLRNLQTSSIIGSVEITGCTVNHPSIWAEKSEIGQDEQTNEWLKPVYNWTLANPILFDKPILNVKGKLGFWDFEMK